MWSFLLATSPPPGGSVVTEEEVTTSQSLCLSVVRDLPFVPELYVERVLLESVLYTLAGLSRGGPLGRTSSLNPWKIGDASTTAP